MKNILSNNFTILIFAIQIIFLLVFFLVLKQSKFESTISINKINEKVLLSAEIKKETPKVITTVNKVKTKPNLVRKPKNTTLLTSTGSQDNYKIYRQIQNNTQKMRELERISVALNKEN